MNVLGSRVSNWTPAFRTGLAVTVFLSGVVGATGAFADDDDIGFRPGNSFGPGNLLISRSVYDNNPANVVAGTTLLPPNCVAPNCVTATDSGAYPYVFNNVLADGSFGITSRIVLDQLKPSGKFVNSLEVEVTHREEHRDQPTRERIVTSFPSKSEIALNLSTDGRRVTFMGYLAPVNAIDVSNSNTPGGGSTRPIRSRALLPRGRVEVDAFGSFHFTETNAYSGNNGRAAILNDETGANIIYTAGQRRQWRQSRSRTESSSGRARRSSRRRTPLGGGADPGLPDACRQLQHHATRTEGRQDRQGHELPRPDDLRQRRLLHEGQWRQRRQHRVLRRRDRVQPTGTACPNGVGLPGPARPCRPRRSPTTHDAADAGLAAEQHVHPEGLSDALQVEDVVSVRDLVCQRSHALPRR